MTAKQESSQLSASNLSQSKFLKGIAKRFYRLRTMLLSDVGVTLTFSVAMRTIAALSTILVARNLGSANFGYYTYTLSTAVLISSIGCLGQQNSANRFFASHHPNARRATQLVIRSCLMSVSVTAVLCICLWWICSGSSSSEWKTIIATHPFSIFIFSSAAAIQTILGASLSGLSHHKLAAISTGITSASISVAGLATSYWYGAHAAITGSAIVAGICAVASATKFFALVRIRDKHQVEISIPYWSYARFGFTTMIGSIITQPIIWLSGTFLSQSNNGLSKVGVLNFALQFRQIILFIPAALGNWMLSKHAQSTIQGASKEEDRKRLLYKHLKLQLVATLLIGILLIAISALVVGEMGEAYSNAQEVVIVIILAASVLTLSNIYSRFTQAQGDALTSLRFDLTWFCIFAAMILLFSKDFLTPLTVAYAHLIAAAGQLGHAAWETQKKWKR